MPTTKAVRFTFITDERFGGTREKLIELDSKLNQAFESSRIRAGDIRELHWKEDHFKQWRKDYRIRKDAETYDSIYGKVNSIQPVHFKITCF